MRLSKHNNGEVLDATRSISEITGLEFEKVSEWQMLKQARLQNSEHS